MRQIRQFTKAIATLLGQSHREQPEELPRAIDEACRTHLDGRAEDLRTLPPDAPPVDDAAQEAPRNRTAQEQRGSGPRDRDQRSVAFQVCELESSGCAYLWNDGRRRTAVCRSLSAVRGLSPAKVIPRGRPPSAVVLH